MACKEWSAVSFGRPSGVGVAERQRWMESRVRTMPVKNVPHFLYHYRSFSLAHSQIAPIFLVAAHDCVVLTMPSHNSTSMLTVIHRLSAVALPELRTQLLSFWSGNRRAEIPLSQSFLVVMGRDEWEDHKVCRVPHSCRFTSNCIPASLSRLQGY